MAQKLNTRTIALSVGATSAVVSVACAALIYVAPTQTVSLFGSIFHGIDMSQIMKTTVSVGELVKGTVVATVTGAAIGALFAKIYNYFA